MTGGLSAMFLDPVLPHYIALAGCVLLTATGQLCLKSGARDKKHVIHSFLNPMTILGYGCLLLVTVGAVYAMQVVDLKVGSTWGSITYLLVVVLARPVLGEPLSQKSVAGCLIIVLGVVVFHLR